MRTPQLALIAALTLASGVAVAQPVPPPPPPPPADLGPPPPGPAARYGLEPGHYTWTGTAYVWVPQRWIFRRPGFVAYVPGHLNRFGIWVPGHWRR